MSKPKPELDERMTEAISLLRRVGARDFELRYSEPESDGSPLVWIAIVGMSIRDGRPRGTGKINHHEMAAHLRPDGAVFALCADLVDGGTCTHCHRTAGFDVGFGAMPLDALVCWYQWDPELKTFRRGCEGN
jgi:hypothetical protein